jgi:hypothetical protein
MDPPDFRKRDLEHSMMAPLRFHLIMTFFCYEEQAFTTRPNCGNNNRNSTIRCQDDYAATTQSASS